MKQIAVPLCTFDPIEWEWALSLNHICKPLSVFRLSSCSSVCKPEHQIKTQESKKAVCLLFQAKFCTSMQTFWQNGSRGPWGRITSAVALALVTVLVGCHVDMCYSAISCEHTLCTCLSFASDCNDLRTARKRSEIGTGKLVHRSIPQWNGIFPVFNVQCWTMCFFDDSLRLSTHKIGQEEKRNTVE